MPLATMKRSSFLRASGGVSAIREVIVARLLFSPRKRRCFCLKTGSPKLCKVFSAQAEVFLNIAYNALPIFRFLRASGGVSMILTKRQKAAPFSPRKRRCFFGIFPAASSRPVFSAQAEVFPSDRSSDAPAPSFLRASGGVSAGLQLFSRQVWFSPRKRRCFRRFWLDRD